MRLRDKIKSYSFWVSLASAIILILKILGTRFGFSIDESMISDLFTALCSILVLLGIIVVPNSPQVSPQKQDSKKQVQIKQDKIDKASLEKTNSVKNLVLENSNNEPNEDENTNIQEEKQLNSLEIKNEIIDNENLASENNNKLSDDNFNIQKTDTIIFAEEPSAEQNFSADTSEQNSIQEQSQEILVNTQEPKENEIVFNSSIKTVLEEEKKKFAGNLDLYIFELQEEIRKTREGM